MPIGMPRVPLKSTQIHSNLKHVVRQLWLMTHWPWPPLAEPQLHTQQLQQQLQLSTLSRTIQTRIQNQVAPNQRPHSTLVRNMLQQGGVSLHPPLSDRILTNRPRSHRQRPMSMVPHSLSSSSLRTPECRTSGLQPLAAVPSCGPPSRARAAQQNKLVVQVLWRTDCYIVNVSGTWGYACACVTVCTYT